MLLNYGIAFFSLFTVIFFLLLFMRHRHEYNEPPQRTSWRPSVSIIMPAYNESEYIKDSLKSIISLDYPKDKLEIIVIDDGSTDETANIAREFADVSVFSKKNEGKGAALNFGIEKANGELIATMDADSYLTPGALLDMLPLFDGPEVGAVTPAVKISETGEILKEVQRVEYLMILFSRKLLSYIDSVPVTPGPFSVFRASILRELGGFDPKNLVEDQEIALRMQSKQYEIKSSMNADVYTEPPDTFRDFIKQRVRWQRGGLRNYWRYRYLIKPEFGDFGMFFVPLNFATIIAFFLLLGLFINFTFSTPYYTQYILIESLGLSIGLFTIIGLAVMAITGFWIYATISSFREDHIKLRYIGLFMVLYWYFMVCYNCMTAYKEIVGAKKSW